MKQNPLQNIINMRDRKSTFLREKVGNLDFFTVKRFCSSLRK